MDTFNFVITNKEFVGIIFTFLGVVIPLAIFLITKNKEQRQLNFERFHKNLMRGLANLDGKTGLDQQIAIIYEFRNYREYYPIIKRDLNYQIERWNSLLKKLPHYKQLINEANETLEFISKNFLCRFFLRIENKK